MKKKIEKIEKIMGNLPNGIIRDADTVLADIMEDVDMNFSGVSQDIFNIWKNSSDKAAVEQMFFEFTGYEFPDFLDECQRTLNSVKMADVVKNWIEEKNCKKNYDLSWLMDSFEESLSKWTPETIENDKSQFFGVLIDATEDFLESIGIEVKEIPSEDREQAIEDGEDPEGLAIIYGEDYDFLADRFTEILELKR